MPLRKFYTYEILDRVVGDADSKHLGNKTVAKRDGGEFAIYYNGEPLAKVGKTQTVVHIVNELKDGRERLDRINRFLPGEWAFYYFQGTGYLFHPDKDKKMAFAVGESGVFIVDGEHYKLV